MTMGRAQMMVRAPLLALVRRRGRESIEAVGGWYPGHLQPGKQEVTRR